MALDQASRQDSIAIVPTARASATRRAGSESDAPLVVPGDLHVRVRKANRGRLTIFVIDSSGSMGAERLRNAKVATTRMLLDAYQRRDRVAVVGFWGTEAKVLLRPTSSVEVAQARLQSLPSGGTTPLAAGLVQAAELAEQNRDDRELFGVVMSDFRPNVPYGSSGLMEGSLQAGARLAAALDAAVIVDTESSRIRLGIGPDLASAMGAGYVAMSELDPEALSQADLAAR